MEKLYEGRAIVEDELTAIRITVPAQRGKTALLFVSCWLVGWSFGEVMALRSLAAEWRNGQFGNVFLTVWLTGWTIGGVSAIRTLLWGMWGKEIITVGQGILTLAATGSLFGKPKSYGLQDVRHLRVQDPAYGEAEAVRRFNLTNPKGAGTIRFDYGLQTVDFASGIDEAEASYLLALLRKNHLLTDKNFTLENQGRLR
jgi:hypothetical protein